jgi:hypothetical protein
VAISSGTENLSRTKLPAWALREPEKLVLRGVSGAIITSPNVEVA